MSTNASRLSVFGKLVAGHQCKGTVASRVSRAIGLANLGELSNARQALEGEAVAPGNELTDENKRPRKVREPLNGPSGATAKHLKLLLESQVCTELFVEAATKLARGRVPPDGGDKVGALDSSPKTGRRNPRYCRWRRVPQTRARTLAQQFCPQVKCATHPFQHALSTRTGTECVAHMVRALTGMDDEATILSVMASEPTTPFPGMQCSRIWADMVDGDKLFPFIRQFYDSLSYFLWEDELGGSAESGSG